MPKNTGRVLLAWEGGAGRGHLITLKALAEALGDGFVYDAALCRMEHAGELAPLCDLVFAGARLGLDSARRAAAGNPNTASWAEFLGDLGFASADRLITQIGWWLATIEARQSSMLIGDFSPIAMLAARIADIPMVAVGTGYSTPPAGMDDFPVLLEEHTTRIYAEHELTNAVNRALQHFGLPPIARFSDIYRDAVPMPRTIPALDPYGPWRSEPLLPPLNEALPRGLGGGGDEIFIYFSTAERDDQALMAAVSDLGLPTRLFMPGIGPELAAQLTSAGVIIEQAPVPLELIARRSRLMLHAGQHGSLCMALGLGLPQIAFPQHLEHLYHARRAAVFGTVTVFEPHQRDIAAIRQALHQAHADAGLARRAGAVSDELYPGLFGDLAGLVRQRLLPLLA